MALCVEAKNWCPATSGSESSHNFDGLLATLKAIELVVNSKMTAQKARSPYEKAVNGFLQDAAVRPRTKRRPHMMAETRM